MNSIIGIFYKPSETFDYLDDQYADELEANCNLIFASIGAINGLQVYFEVAHLLADLTLGAKILVALVIVLFSAGIGLFVGKYLVTYLLYGMGRLLNGKGEVIDIRVVTAYALLPNVIRLPQILYGGLTHKYNLPVDPGIQAVSFLSLVVSVWTLIILIKGLMRFNKYGILKAFINISPLMALGLLRIFMGVLE